MWAQASCISCAAGYYQPNAAQTSCIACSYVKLAMQRAAQRSTLSSWGSAIVVVLAIRPLLSRVDRMTSARGTIHRQFGRRGAQQPVSAWVCMAWCRFDLRHRVGLREHPRVERWLFKFADLPNSWWNMVFFVLGGVRFVAALEASHAFLPGPGYYQPISAQTGFLACQAGTYSPRYAATSCTACTPGTMRATVARGVPRGSCRWECCADL